MLLVETVVAAASRRMGEHHVFVLERSQLRCVLGNCHNGCDKFNFISKKNWQSRMTSSHPWADVGP